MLKKIKQIPVWLSIVVMLLCMVAGVALGNKNALDQAVAGTSANLLEATELARQRVDMAEHRLLTLCKRYIPDHEATQALAQAVEVCRRAKTPGEIAQADLTLSAAAESVIAPLSEVARATDKELAVGVRDDMISAGKILKRCADAYNGGLADVQKVYNALPARWLLGGMPEAYR